MKFIPLFILLFFASSFKVIGQTKTISGRVIFAMGIGEKAEDSELHTLPETKIYSIDNSELGKANEDGFFTIKIDTTIKQIEIGYVGYEHELIELSNNCEFLEVILVPLIRYEFMSKRKIDRLLKKDKEKLPELYTLAYLKGFFTKPVPCR